ncbi:MAG: Asp-tRNA(Asn)/Glu-tRNA(Gln) amidotransferase subunit GatA [Actinomycetota bacterium]
MPTDPLALSAVELAAALRAREISAMQLAEAALQRVSDLNERVNAFLSVTGNLAREQAEDVDRRLGLGQALPPAAGIPIALKDVLAVKGVTATCGSRILEPYVPPYDSTVWSRLREAGAVLVGKTNCDEFAMGSSGENSAYGVTRNPWDLDRVPGGSSSGSAAAVASGMATWALGTDTGGSVRQPAALCGVVGLKPTYGRISRYGLIAFASSLDHVGTFTRTTRDAALLLSTLAGVDPKDATSVEEPAADYSEGLDAGVGGVRVGVIKESFAEGVEPGVTDAFRASIERLEGLGATCEEVSLPNADYAFSAYYLLAPAECSSNLARYDGVRYGHRTKEPVDDVVQMMMKTRGEGFGDEVKRRIILGTYSLSAGYYDAYYGQAQKVRTLVIRDYQKAFEGFDVLLSPTSPTTAFRIGERTDDPIKMYLSDIFTIPADLAGVPSISVPCGLDADGLPVGLQFTGPLLGERAILRAAHAFEQDFGFRLQPPLLAAA